MMRLPWAIRRVGVAFRYGARRSRYCRDAVLLVSLVAPSRSGGFIRGRTIAGVDGMHMEARPSRSSRFGATEGCIWLSRAGARGAKLLRCFKYGVLGVHSGDCNQSQRRLQRFRTEVSPS